MRVQRSGLGIMSTGYSADFEFPILIITGSDQRAKSEKAIEISTNRRRTTDI